MDLTIRSQNKELLMECVEIRYNQKGDDHSILSYDTRGDYRILGIYDTKKRALEILDDIHNCIQINATFNLYSRLGSFANNFNEKHYFIPVYQMPKE